VAYAAVLEDETERWLHVEKRGGRLWWVPQVVIDVSAGG
jgi:hypothetical protein